MHDTATSQTMPTGTKRTHRVVGLDAARGLALLGLLAAHTYPEIDEDTGAATVAHQLFAGDSAALFVLLAGVGLALLTGGRTPHVGQRMTADRVGVAVRAVLVGIVGLLLAALMPEEPPVNGILLYFAVFFLLAIPFLSRGPRALFLSAAACAVVTPFLMQNLYADLPETSVFEHTVVTLFTEPAGAVAELLLTGTYPALAYMAFVLTGMGLGRLNLASTRVQVLIAGTGAVLAILANAVSFLLLRGAGGYEALVGTAGMTRETVDEALVLAPEVLPDTSGWWLVLATPHTNTPFAIASSLGMALLVVGAVLLLAARIGRWLAPLTAMGAMTMTLYSSHMVVMSFELHYDDPTPWYIGQVAGAAIFALAWSRWVGRGPLEWVMTTAAQRAKRIALDGASVDAAPRNPSPSPAAESRDLQSAADDRPAGVPPAAGNGGAPAGLPGDPR